MTWDEALWATWRQHLNEPTEWGVLDCCQFVREYVHTLTGRDYGGHFDYGSEAEAEALLARHGGAAGLVSLFLGEPRDPEPGDVVTTEAGGIGVWNGKYVIGVHPEHGVIRYRAKVTGAWQPR